MNAFFFTTRCSMRLVDFVFTCMYMVSGLRWTHFECEKMTQWELNGDIFVQECSIRNLTTASDCVTFSPYMRQHSGKVGYFEIILI